MSDTFLLSIVVPVYNEEKNIKPFIERMRAVCKSANCQYEMIFSLDPCSDNTEQEIKSYINTDPGIKLIKFSRRFGQPTATKAAIDYCTGDACVVIDVDLQDPPELIEQMVEKWREGYHVVYAQRITREGETWVKRVVSYFGYWLINSISNLSIPRNTGDFRLMDKTVVSELKKMTEPDPFLRGIVAYVGFSQYAIKYNRDARLHGKGNYNRWLGSLTIGFNGIIGFSKYPLHFIAIMGFTISFFSFLLAAIYIVLKLLGFPILWGNPTLVILISTLGGLQMLSLGIMGQYMARTFEITLKRQSYIVEESIGFQPG